MSLQHIIRANIDSSSLGTPILGISPPSIASNLLVAGNSVPRSSASAIVADQKELPNGVYRFTGGSTGTFTVVPASTMAASLVDDFHIHPSIGTSFPFQVDNQNSGNVTISAGADPNVTIVATATLATGNKRTYIYVFTNVTLNSEAASVY